MLFILLMVFAPLVFIFLLFAACIGVYYIGAVVQGMTRPYYMYSPDNRHIQTDTFTVKTPQTTHYGRDECYYDNDYERD